MLFGCLIVLNIIKIIPKMFKNYKTRYGHLQFWEIFKFLVCFMASFMIMLLTFYFYTLNLAQCPLTFHKYQLTFCECDLLAREFHKFFDIPDYDLNNLCITRYENNILYVDSPVQFSNHMQIRNNDKGKKIE